MSSSPSNVVKTIIRAAGELLANLGYCFHAAHVGQAQIHQRHVGLMLPEKIEGILAIRSLGDYSHIRHGVEQGHEALPHDVVILHNHDSDSISQSISVSTKTCVPSPTALFTVSFASIRSALSRIPFNPKWPLE
jgi:hypothetical protein